MGDSLPQSAVCFSLADEVMHPEGVDDAALPVCDPETLAVRFSSLDPAEFERQGPEDVDLSRRS